MRCVVLMFAVSFGLLWGIVQGMVMVQPGDARAVRRLVTEYRPEGVRNHTWFGVYHLVCVVMMLAGLALAMAWDLGLPRGDGLGCLRYAVWSLGCAALSWEASECGYSWARWARWMPAAERLVFLDLAGRIARNAQVRAVHAARIAAGVTLLMIGGLT